MDGNGNEREQRYADFLDRFGGNIVNFCNDSSDSLHEAKDLMQDVLAALWIVLPQLRTDSTPRQQNRWLYRVMHTVLWRHLRRWRKGKHRLLPMRVSDDIAAPEDDGQAALLAELSAALPDKDRALVDDTLAGYSTNEIASRHGMTPGSVSTRMNRIKKKLNTIYDKLYG